MERWLCLVQGHVLFRTVKPSLYAALGSPPRPETPLTYEGGLPTEALLDRVAEAHAAGSVPAIFFEPYALDWERLRLALAGQPALFILRDRMLLGHALQFPELLETLLAPEHVIYGLSAFPEDLLREQPALGSWCAARSEGPLFCPIFLEASPDEVPERSMKLRALALVEQWLRARRAGPTESEALARWAFRFSLALRDELNLQRLGGARTFAYLAGVAAAAWTSPHKGLAPPEAAADLAFPDRVEGLLAPHRAGRRPRPLRSESPLRVAHVVPQLVDGGHAPSRLLRTLLAHHDRSRFQPSVFVTERLVMRRRDHPVDSYASTPSRERAKETLARLAAEGLSVYLDDARLDAEATGIRLAERLSAAGIDVAVFHGPDFINLVAAQRTDVPLRVFFDHGSPPGHAGFDLIGASTDDVARVMAGTAGAQKARVVSNSYFVNVRDTWRPDRYPLSFFGVPDDAQILTTISNNLESRLTDEMCQAIAEILRRCPRAWYVPIGPVARPQVIAERFLRHGVPPRARFFGPSPEPSQLARSMKLFLNEFPFGSGLAMLDAMAAGCPVVTMYDPDGPPQARFGGIYMGVDRAITSLRREDYVDLACRLLEDETLYEAWSREAVSRYEARTDLAGYVRRFEAAIEESLRSAL
jgi:glycosyltransferase involved in cell wall biosynthesis